MKAEIVIEALSLHLERVARCENLGVELDILRDMLATAEREMVDDEVSLSQEITGMPHGSTIGDPTGKLGLKLACGYENWNVKQIKEEMKNISEERIVLGRWISFVNAWLKSLTEKERMLVELKYIQKLSWDEIINAYQKAYGQKYGKSGMKLLVQKSIEKVYRIADGGVMK